MQNYHVQPSPTALDPEEFENRVNLSMKHCSKSDLFVAREKALKTAGASEDDEESGRVHYIIDRIDSEIERRSAMAVAC